MVLVDHGTADKHHDVISTSEGSKEASRGKQWHLQQTCNMEIMMHCDISENLFYLKKKGRIFFLTVVCTYFVYFSCFGSFGSFAKGHVVFA